MHSPHILILGATGVSGHDFVPVAMNHPSKPRLTLYARSPNRLPTGIENNPRIRVVKGELSDVNALKDAMEGVDTVISFLGAYFDFWNLLTRAKDTPLADSFLNVFDAMRAKGVKRVFTLSTAGGYPIEGDKPTWAQWAMVVLGPKLMVPRGSAEMGKLGSYTAAQSDMDWTIFRVPYLDPKLSDSNLKVEAGKLNAEFKGTTSLGRPSMGRWLLDEIQERKFVKGAPNLGNP